MLGRPKRGRYAGVWPDLPQSIGLGAPFMHPWRQDNRPRLVDNEPWSNAHSPRPSLLNLAIG
jgi:hypothetical protein